MAEVDLNLNMLRPTRRTTFPSSALDGRLVVLINRDRLLRIKCTFLKNWNQRHGLLSSQLQRIVFRFACVECHSALFPSSPYEDTTCKLAVISRHGLSIDRVACLVRIHIITNHHGPQGIFYPISESASEIMEHTLNRAVGICCW